MKKKIETQMRLKMGLLRQNHVERQSTEYSPLLESNDGTQTIEENGVNNQNIKAVCSISNTIRKKNNSSSYKNSKGQQIITLHRGMLKKQSSSSSSSLKASYSNDENEKTSKFSTNSQAKITFGLLLAMFGAGTMYGLTGIFVRMAAQNGVGTVETLFARGAFQTLFFGLLICVQRKPFIPAKENRWFCLIISISYASASFTSFEAFNAIPPGNAIASRGAARTIFSIILAFLLNHELISKKDTISVLFCLIGMSCIVASSFVSNSDDRIPPTDLSGNYTLISVYGYVLVIFAGVSRSLGMVVVRKLNGILHPFVIVVFHSTLTLIVSLPLLFLRPLRWPPTTVGALYTMAICLTSSVATFSSNSALLLIHPALVSMGQNTDMVVSIILGHVILHQTPGFLEIFGASLILASITSIAWMRWQKSKTEDVQRSVSSE